MHPDNFLGKCLLFSLSLSENISLGFAFSGGFHKNLLGLHGWQTEKHIWDAPEKASVTDGREQTLPLGGKSLKFLL